MKILFISYYFDPFPGVGAKRVSYWADEISKYGIKPTVITAIEQNEKKEYPVHYIPNTHRKRFLSKFIKDEGYSWELDLIDFINKSDLPNFDYVLISGGPFMHMGITQYLKKQLLGIKVILDFRDPFGHNPRFNESIIKRKLKQHFETKFIKNSDEVIVVNEFCKNLVKQNNNVKIIENGFDERLLPEINNASINSKVIFVYAGKLYTDRSPITFCKIISSNHDLAFKYIGPDIKNLDSITSENIIYEGVLTYEKTLNSINKSDIGLIFTGGKAFESTTKIFDYIALNKKILIITEGEPKTGNLHEITKNYPNVVWSKNNTDAIKKSINELKEMKAQAFDSSVFSRKKSLERLVTLLKSN